MWIPETELKWLGLEASPFIYCALSPAQLELLREHLPSDSKKILSMTGSNQNPQNTLHL